MSCRDVRDWLHRDASELDEAQRLILDDHLAGCDRCQGDRARLRQVRTIGTSLETGLDQRDLNRAIARALMEGTPRREAAPVRRRWGLALILAGAGLAAAATTAGVVATRGSNEDVSTSQPSTPPPPPAVPQRAAPAPIAPEPDAASEQLRASADLLAAAAVAAAAVEPARPIASAPPKGPTLAELLRLAETAQAAGQLDVAIAHYTELASRFAGAAEAESALYAAARLELRSGHAARAKTLLDAYLSRYPRGRYADDARRELSLIRSPEVP